ncbi:methionyl-tRNA formyltransferase [Phenylobacterium sp. Root77]|uniref:methionyl-tRNA formyltransferase n=1 Tax=unclassified Phenylobacterium TaxID=2640670 RepID=UPI0006F67C55|nr:MULTISPECIES: methionyl-tRNA formyltransferase [unclassified Phenylobacterium]KQW73374.1 methionyl-tRNA formyltransferase [Phenylobacterium sp. Root1277]KQW92593.1 methionyl-tRNA formyltransferase [Phenylobacterium sp. Root1290]KRC40822.1 methionyl-tRNA formyltransferase [Phenylobacterium sp. Root77]
MRIAFLGTPDFAVAALAALVEAGHEVACVYSQPPAPRGRGQTLKPSPVHAYAEEQGIPVRTPASMRDPAEIEAFAALNLDAGVVVAFGQILPAAVLDAPRLGCFNLHASLLPRWRGAAPIQRAIMAGDLVTGVEVMQMTEGLDEGPVLASETVRIDALETASTLHDRLAVVGAALLARTMAAVERGEAKATPQAAEGETYAKKIRPKEARIRWDKPAAEVDRKIRGLSPFPGAWFELPTDKGPVRVKALLSRLEDGAGAPGQVLDDALLVACGEGAVRLLRIQREGKGPQDAETFLRGAPVAAGTRLG